MPGTCLTPEDVKPGLLVSVLYSFLAVSDEEGKGGCDIRVDLREPLWYKQSIDQSIQGHRVLFNLFHPAPSLSFRSTMSDNSTTPPPDVPGPGSGIPLTLPNFGAL